MPFPDDCVVMVQQMDDEEWLTRAVIQYTGNKEPFEVPLESKTDFASVPRVFIWFLPRYGRYTKAAILHDFLWRERAKKGLMTWRDADGVFRRAMRDLNVPFLRRWIMWAAVRWAGLKNANAWRDWWKDAPRVLLVTLLALPIVVPPAIVIAIALLVWLVIEAIVWVPLKLGELAVRRFRPQVTPKQVNAPQLDWKS